MVAQEARLSISPLPSLGLTLANTKHAQEAAAGGEGPEEVKQEDSSPVTRYQSHSRSHRSTSPEPGFQPHL